MRIAVVTHSFPPSTHSNAKRPFYVVRALLEAGWEVDVFTSRLACAEGAAPELDHPRLTVVWVDDPVDRFRQRFARRRTLQRWVSMLVAGLLWPDQYALWAKRLYRRHLAPARYDRVLVFVFPPSAYLARERVTSKWIFDLQESVTPQFRRLKRRSPLQRWRLPAMERLEREALQSAGKVVFTAETNRQAYIAAGLVPAGKTTHLPYFFDADYFGGARPAVAEAFEIHYFGTFDWRGSRSPAVFLHALAGFLREWPEARARTRFVFRGTWFPGHDAVVDGCGLRDVVEIRPAVSYHEYLRMLGESPVLLLVVAPEHNLFMPSKIVDYFGAGRPILALVPRDSEMRAVLDEAGMGEFAADHDDADGCRRALAALWERYADGRLSQSAGSVEKWSSATRLPAYVRMLEEVP